MGDVRAAIRQLLQAPGFSLAAILVLALGIGLNAAMFSVVHALTIAPPAFTQPDRVVQLYARDTRPAGGYRAFSYPVYRELASHATMFSGVLAHNPTLVGVGDGAQSRRTLAAVVSANYFDVLGVAPARGRTFTAQEDRPGADSPVVIVSDGFWQRTGRDEMLLGRTIRINERPFTVIGITPRGFTGTMSVVGPELFFPLGVFHSLVSDYLDSHARSLERVDAYNLFIVARLRDGVPIETAAAGLGVLGDSLGQSFPAEHAHHALSLAPLPKFGTSTSPSDEGALVTLGVVMMGLTSAVLLTVCLNLASMLLARGRGRRREFAVRLAVGASRFRLVRQLLVEGLLLAGIGGAIGFALGRSAVRGFVASLSAILPVSIVLEDLSSPALVIGAAGFCLFATLLFALGPALTHSRADIVTDLKVQPGDDARPRRWRSAPRNPLVAAQVALSLCLLIAAGLFVRMAAISADLDLRLDADATVLAEVDAQLGGLDEEQALALYARVEERLSSLPGVSSATVGTLVPLGMVNLSRDLQRAGVRVAPGEKPVSPETGQAFDARTNAIGGGYFAAMGIPLLRGRTFTSSEVYGRGGAPVVVLDEALAAKLWPDGTALGQQVQWAPGDAPATDSLPMEVVGIVATTRTGLFEREPGGTAFLPLAQNFASSLHFHVRPTEAHRDLTEAVRQEIRSAAPGIPLFKVQRFADHIETAAEYWLLRASTLLFGLFGGFAMAIALVGIYGVTSYAVVRRTREIGVRLAVGAAPGRVVRSFLADSLTTAVGGIVLGWLLGLGVGRLMASVFVDLPAFDLLTFAVVPAGFVLAALAATWLAARRAAGVSPTVALRAD